MGDLLAVAMTFGNTAYIVLIRKFADLRVVWACGASTLQLFLVGALIGSPFDVSAQDGALLILFGDAFDAAVVLCKEGTRLIPTAQSALLGAVEIPCATLLAWVIFDELPSVAAGLGGTVIMAAILWHAAIRTNSAVPRLPSKAFKGLDTAEAFTPKASPADRSVPLLTIVRKVLRP